MPVTDRSRGGIPDSTLSGLAVWLGGVNPGWFRWDETTLGWMMERRWRSRRGLRAAPCTFHRLRITVRNRTRPGNQTSIPRYRRIPAHLRAPWRCAPIPTGLNHPAQGCEERATLGIAPTTGINPERVELSDAEHAAAAIRSAVRSTLSGLTVWLDGTDPG